MIYFLGIYLSAESGVEKSTTVLIFPLSGKTGIRNPLEDPPALMEDTLTKKFRGRANGLEHSLFRFACENAARIAWDSSHGGFIALGTLDRFPLL